ncbi:MAG: hypothetical protein ACJAX7_001193 [Saprospiraceae bacterium]|jgi:hypothetical protein|uniref:heme-binding domain-containing protein n=1 Tax=Candidatus Marifrigoribacter sp. Uisw_064 TaxID=3230970 RepID=UPI003AEC1650
MKKTLKYIWLLLLVVLFAMQFIRPNKNNGGLEGITAFKNDTKPSDNVLIILKQNCFDCHSDSTKYPWYAEIAPISYWLADHVKEGKGDFNMSAWQTYSIKKKDHKLEELVEELEEGEMPLDSYTWIHGKLSKEDQERLIQWATLARIQYQDELKVSFK